MSSEDVVWWPNWIVGVYQIATKLRGLATLTCLDISGFEILVYLLLVVNRR